ncbi:hypothetical protein KCH_10280 [Kitasatospora cheerisanensis KCTC 2395]|uniref:Uncharacterized protein n=1 Tax=Kitasatospora cheerisanensis KCTC 2395 TaxID=1348663 RepID=A0A066Z171_9ACTN|nr:hypothetical protein KCH_10280 [Kitasatospora cheerisanensis KCTC 2395]
MALRLVDETAYARTVASPDLKVQPVPGIGDSAVLVSAKEDGRNPELLFTVGGARYGIEAVADRGELGAANAPAEVAAEQALARLAAPRLHS